MGVFSNKIDRTRLMAGDHIYSWRIIGHLYAHHGIYYGKDKVIHFTSPAGKTNILSFSPSSSTSSNNCQRCAAARQELQVANEQAAGDGVIISCLDCFLKGGELYLFTYSVSRRNFLFQSAGTCTMAPSDKPEEVLNRARFLLNHGFGKYSLFSKNCEDFAIYCKTSLIAKGRSSSGGQVKKLRKGLFYHFLWRDKDDIPNRTDLEKVSVEMILEFARSQGTPNNG